jgi:hypothetical protein
MTTGLAAVLRRRVCRLAGAENSDRLADAELLGRFVAQRDEAAFEALVRRHGQVGRLDQGPHVGDERPQFG